MLRLSCFLIGEDYHRIRQATVTSRQQIANMGIALLLPVILWFILGFCLSYVALNCSILIAILVGAICSFLIYLLERLILMLPTTTRWMMFARVLMALAISTVGGIGLKLLIYDGDINRKLEAIHKAKLDSLDRSFDRFDTLRRKQLTEVIATKRAKRDSLQNVYIDELQGRGSGQGGNGPIAKAIQVQLDTARNDVERTQVALAEHDKTYETRKAENRQQATRDNGLQLRLNLMYELVTDSWHSILFFVALLLLLFGFECIVLFVKLSLKETAIVRERRYAERLAEQQYQA